jgi:adenylate cyclase class 2
LSGSDYLEVEVKFLVRDVVTIRKRLEATGAELRKARLFEQNVRFDNAWQGLRRKGQLLRLRQDDAARITFKAIPAGPGSQQVKVREELEVTVSDFDTAALLLERIGFEAHQRYEKYRTTYQLAEVEVVLDEMPFGNFVELEGAEAGIRAVAGTLRLDWERRILDNYLALMGRLKAEHDLPFDDLTFANFAGTAATVYDLYEAAA